MAVVKLAVIILAHRDPAHLARLLRRLQHPLVRAYLHVDRRTDLAAFRDALAGLAPNDPVLLKRHPSPWGAPGCVDGILEGMRAGLQDGCDYFMLVSGQDFPLQPVEEIVAFAAENLSRSFIEHWPLSLSRHRFEGRDRTDFYAFTIRGRRELCIPRGEDTSFLNRRGKVFNELLRVRATLMPRRRFPDYVEPFTGATWWNLSRAGIKHCLRFLDAHPDYRAYHEYTWVPEELFFQSIIGGTEFRDAEEVINDNLRFYRWSDVHARPLTIDDLPAIQRSDKLFGRKFDSAVDATVISALERLLAA